MKQILTMEQLVSFCKNNQLFSFNSKQNGYQLVVRTDIESFSIDTDTPLDNSSQGLLFCNVKACHTLLNRNGSYISEDNMVKAMPSLVYRPLLAHIHQLDDGTYDFHTHDIEIKDDNIEYIETQVGTFTADQPYLEYDEEAKKTYVMAKVAIPTQYTKAAEIIERKQGTKVSVELVIDSMAYNAKENYLEIIDFYFSGCTLLGSEKDGTPIGEGMEGSKLTLTDFTYKPEKALFDNKIVELLENVQNSLSEFNRNYSEKGGVVEMEDMTNVVESTPEVVEEFTETSVEETPVEVVVTEAEEVIETIEEPESVEETIIETESEDLVEEEIETEVEPEVIKEAVIEVEAQKNRYSIDESGNVKLTYDVSHEDIRNGLYNLLYTEKSDETWYWIVEVYDNYFIYEEEPEYKFYKRSYSVENESVSLNEGKVEVFTQWLTSAEIEALKELKSDFEAAKEELGKYQAKELEALKEGVITSADYSKISNTEAFKAIVEKVEEYSLEELKDACDKVLLDYSKSEARTFAATLETKPETKKIGFSHQTSKKSGRYGNLFTK